ncbi:MAG: hypothetical protein HOE90_01315 [Bacteriovoracaceae bacterium]|jgi:hypothetical protein|nr:hypothetical protein [Bacteriovoracaceae bacterium]
MLFDKLLFSAEKDDAPAAAAPAEEKPQLARKKLEDLNKKYQTRITVARQGQEAYSTQDYVNAITYYNQYLKIIAEVKGADMATLRPKHFEKRDTSEMLLISHIYWDLAKIYDLTPHLKTELRRVLDQFSTFTINQPYQIVNSEMLRKFIKKGRMVNDKIFQESYKKIQVSSKKCFIATYAFGCDAPTTNRLRLFKSFVMRRPMGFVLVDHYYRISPHLINFFQQNEWVGKPLTTIVIKPLLFLISLPFKK